MTPEVAPLSEQELRRRASFWPDNPVLAGVLRLCVELDRLRECNRLGAEFVQQWGCHAIANADEVKRLRFEATYVREVLLTANPLTFGTDGTLAGDDVPLAEVARQAAEKIYQLRQLHAEMVAEVERRGIENGRLSRAVVRLTHEIDFMHDGKLCACPICAAPE